MYTCPQYRPRHLSVAIDKFRYQMLYTKLIGGVLNFKLEHFIKANGLITFFNNNKILFIVCIVTLK